MPTIISGGSVTRDGPAQVVERPPRMEPGRYLIDSRILLQIVSMAVQEGWDYRDEFCSGRKCSKCKAPQPHSLQMTREKRSSLAQRVTAAIEATVKTSGAQPIDRMVALYGPDSRPLSFRER